MFDTHFGLSENPFHVIPSQKFYFPSLQHEPICQQVVDNIYQHRGLMLLTGQTGAGKTLVIKQVISQLSSSTTVLLYQNQPDTKGLMTYLQKSLNLDKGIGRPNTSAAPPTSRKVKGQQNLNQLIQDIKTVDINQLIHVINQPVSTPTEQNSLSGYLDEQFKQNRNVVLFIDNINDIERNTLDTLFTLSQLDTAVEPLLQIVISCSPAIGTKLHQHYQNNVTTCQLLPLQNKEVAPYIDHLLRIAGYTDKFPFTREATRKIAAHSQGIPSLVNYLCRSALFTASFDQQQTITAEMIDLAACSYVNQTNNEATSLPMAHTSQKQVSSSPLNQKEFAYEPAQKNSVIKPVAIERKLATKSIKVLDKKIIRVPATTSEQKKSRAKPTAPVRAARQQPASIKNTVASPRILHPINPVGESEVRVNKVHLADIKKTNSGTLKQNKGNKPEKRVPQKVASASTMPSASKVTDLQPSASLMDGSQTFRSTRKTNTPELKPQPTVSIQPIKSTSKIVRSTGNEEQSHETWRMAVYDSLLLFVTIGCVVTLYQFQAKGGGNLSTHADVFASWNDLEQLERETSPLTTEVVLRIANLNPFDFKIMPALAAAFFKGQGANSVNTVQSKTGSITIVQGHFKKNSGIASTQTIEIEPISIDSKYKGMTTGKVNLGVSLTPLSQKVLNSFQDKKLRPIIFNNHTLAFASVAVIVNPSNPVGDLSTEQMTDILQGKITNWQLLEGKSGNIHIHTLGEDYEYLQNVLAHSLGNIKIIKSINHETPEQLIKAMANDINSIGLVNVTDIGNMKSLAISTKAQKAVPPSSFTLAKRTYPLEQAIHVYELNRKSDVHTNKFIRFIYSDTAQIILKQNGFISTGKKSDLMIQKNTEINPEIFHSLTEQAQQLSSNIRFNSTMAILNDVAQRQIDRVTDLLKQLNLKEDKLVILGYSYNGEFSDSNLTISEARAEAVAQAFEARGIVPAVVKGLGSWNPYGNISANGIDISNDQLPEIQIWTHL